MRGAVCAVFVSINGASQTSRGQVLICVELQVGESVLYVEVALLEEGK